MKYDFKKLMIFITIITMDVLTGMEFDLFVPSFSELQSYFSLSPSWVEALLSANFIGYFLSLIFLGDLSDRYGRKPIILFGLIIFVIGSVLCLWPPSYQFLLIGRFLQGVGIAPPAILSFVIIADTYPIKEQQYFMAIINGSLNIAVALAPVIGSYVTLLFHWQGNFAVLLALGMLALLMSINFIPTNQPKQSKEALSLSGMRGYLELFSSKPLALLLINLLFIFVPYWIFVGISPLLYMQDLDVSLTHFGYYQGILAFVFAIGSILYGVITKNIVYDQKKVLKLTLYILIISLVVLTIITILNIRNPLIITLGFLAFIIGQIIPAIILYPLCLNFIPHAKGRVSAIIQGGRLILTSVALQIVGYIYVGSFQNIGLILIGFILVGIVTLYFVINNRELMKTI